LVRNIFKRVWRFLVRTSVAAVLIAIVLFLVALGSCFPQVSSSLAADAERLAGWEMGVEARYGSLTELLATLGVFRWFRAPVFLVSLILLATATLVCTLDRWRVVWWRAFHRPVRCADAVFETNSHAIRLTGLPAAGLPHRLAEHLAERGFQVRSETSEDLVHLRGDRNRLAPLATLVTHLAVLLLLLGVTLSRGYGWQEELTIEPDEIAQVEHGSGLALRNEGFTIVRYPDGNAAAYQADVAVIEDGQQVLSSRIQVNQPLTYGGVGFYLSGYGGEAGRYRVTLLAVRDPGYGPIILAGFLLLLGLTVSFYFPPCLIHARIEPDGALRLAGRTERQAGDFRREFTTLVEGLRHWAENSEEDPD
jgi:cytochrome c biogenesis protein ResB